MKDFVKKLAEYNKLWVALAGVAVTVVARRYGVDSDVYTLLVPFLTALGVYAVPNK